MKSLKLNAFLFLFFISSFTNKLNAQWEKMGNLYGGNYSLAAGSGKLIAYGRGKAANISLDTGKHWRKILDFANGNDLYFKDIYVHNNKIFAVNTKNITISKDNGRTWFSSPNTFQGGTMYDMIIAEGSIYVTVLDSLQTPSFSIFKYNENTDKWESQSQFPQNTMTFTVSENKMYAYTLTGLFASNKNPTQWVKKANTPIDYRYFKDVVKITASDLGVVITNGLYFYASQDEGITWNQPFGLIGANCCVVYKNKKFYCIYGSSDADAKNWQPLFSPANDWKDFSSADTYDKRLILSDNSLYLAYGSIGIMTMNVDEQRWRYLPSTPEISGTRRLIKLGNNSLLASAGWTESFYKSSDEGRNWTTIGSIPEIYNGNSAGPTGDIIAKNNFVFMNANLSPYERILYNTVRSEDYGVTWKTDANFPVFGDFVFRGDTLYTIGTTSSFFSKGGIQYSLPPYTTWKKITEANAYRKMVFIDDIIIAASTGDSVLRMTKNGDFLPVSSAKAPFNLKDMFVKNNRIYASSSIDSLYISSDKGLTWKSKPFVRKPGYSSSFYMTSVNDVLIAMPEFYAPYISKDDGNTWIPFNLGLPQNVDYGTVSYFQDSKYLYASFGRIGIYRRLLSDFTVNAYSGKVFNDKNNNGAFDDNELPISNAVISSKISKAFSVTDKDGYYILETEPTPNDTIRLTLNTPYATVSPKFHVPVKTDSSYNFSVYYKPDVKDLRISATAITPPRPGFEHSVLLTVENLGNADVRDPILSLGFDDKVQFVSATKVPSEVTTQLLNWKLYFIAPSEKYTTTVTFKTPPTVPLNTRLTSIAKIEPILGDTFPKNNIDTLNQIVVGSFDPNDKQVNMSKSFDIRQLKADSPFVYTIRFQNTGNYPATFIRILDTLSTNLDISSVQFLASSHPSVFTVRKKGILDFYFDNINLPDSTTNELGSHGFVKYSVKPLSTLLLNDVIKNKAYIYFDYNAPIITNTTESKIVMLNASSDLVQWKSFNTTPNPTDGIAYFQLPESLLGNKMHLSITNSVGNILLEKTLQNESINQVNLTELNDGLYFIVVDIDNKRYRGKVMLIKK